MDTQTPEWLLVDGTAMLFRAYFSGIRQQTPSGLEIGGVALVAQRLKRLLSRRRPAHVAMVFDAGHRTFRHAITTEYKGHRDPLPDDMRPQFKLVQAISVQLGLACFCVRGFEADDLMATLVHHGRSMGYACHMLSADKDLHQLITDADPAVTQEEARSRRCYDARGVRQRLGVYPHQVVDFLSLVGDACDNVPGVRGIGPKTAAALLEHRGSLDAIYDNLDAVTDLPIRGASTLPDKLRAGRDNAMQARRLITLRQDVDLGVSPDDLPRILRYRGPRGRSADDLFSMLGIPEPLHRLRRALYYGSTHRQLASA